MKENNRNFKIKRKYGEGDNVSFYEFKEGESDVVGVNNSHMVINDAMNYWTKKRIVQNIVNEKNEVMNRNKNWAVGERIIGLKNKRVDFFIRVQTT